MGTGGLEDLWIDRTENLTSILTLEATPHAQIINLSRRVFGTLTIEIRISIALFLACSRLAHECQNYLARTS
jgi:hypothetical protein